jgi:hypothetical protein
MSKDAQLGLRSRLAASAAIALLAALPASAAQAATSTDTTQFSVTAGTLSFSTAPDVPNMPSLTLNGQSQTLNATMNNFTAVDATGSGSGWKVTVNGNSGSGLSPVFAQYCPAATTCNGGADAAGAYVSGGATLAASSIALNTTGASLSAQSGTTGTAPTFQSPCTSAPGCGLDVSSGSPTKVVSAAVNAGMGTWATTGFSSTSLALSAPTTVKALPTNEVYHLDLLWTLGSGP